MKTHAPILRRIRDLLVPGPDPDPLVKKRGFGWGWLIYISLLGPALLGASRTITLSHKGLALSISLPVSAFIYLMIRKQIIENSHYGNKAWKGSFWAGLLAFIPCIFLAGVIFGLVGRPSRSAPPGAIMGVGLPEILILLAVSVIVVLIFVLPLVLNSRFMRSQRARMSEERPAARFSSPGSRARWAKGLLVATLMVAAAAVVSGVLQIELLSRMARGFGSTLEEATRNDSRQRIVGLLQALVGIGTLVTFLLWFHRTHKNLPSLGQRKLLFTPGWAVGFFFVPFLCFFRPFQAMREVWQGSDPGRLDPEVTGDRHGGTRSRLGTPPLVGWWWALFVVSVIVSTIVARLLLLASTDGTLVTLVEARTISILAVVSDLLSIASASVTIRLVGRLTSWQIEKARSIGERAGQAAMAQPAGIESSSSSGETQRAGGKKAKAWWALVIVAPILVAGVFLLTKNGKREEVSRGTGAGGPYIAVGSTKEEVLRIQGPPTSKLEMVWFYGDSQVQFDSEGKVNFLWDYSQNLKVKPEKTP